MYTQFSFLGTHPYIYRVCFTEAAKGTKSKFNSLNLRNYRCSPRIV